MNKVMSNIFSFGFLSNVYYALFKYKRLKLIINNDINIPFKELYSKGIKFSHPLGIVISKHSKIGLNCRIYQGVTIGKHGKYKGAPVIGDNVVIFSGAVIVGGVKIGENSIIGANSFVNEHVQSNSFVAGSPARVIRRLN